MKCKLHRFMTLMAMVMLIVIGIPMALSADAQIPRKESGLQSFPVEATTQIYKGALVCTNGDGYLVAGADAAAYRFVGIAYESVLGTTQGALNCRVHTGGVFKLACTSITQAMVGKILYVVDDATVDDSATYYIPVGRLVEYVSATSGWVDIGQRAISAEAPYIHGMVIFDGAVYFDTINVGAAATLGGGASIAGTTDLQTVIVGSSLAIAAGGLLTIPQKTSATQLPSADPAVAGELWVDAGTVKRSAG